MKLLQTVLCCMALWHLAAEATPPAGELRHTYSVIARDPATGEIGGGVQTHWFNVGVGVLWAEAGVGAVASQSLLDPSYGPRGLAGMREQRAPAEILKDLLSQDEGQHYRQVAMLNAEGDIAQHSGSYAIAEYCHARGDNYAVQANLMWRPGVCQAMSTAFEITEGDLAARIMAALHAAQAAGGDIRGRQSAALLIVEGEKGTPDYEARKFDLRVDDAAEPLRELNRLLGVARAYRYMDDGDELIGRGEIEAALAAYRAGMELQPGNHEMIFWTALTLLGTGDWENAEPLFAQAFGLWPPWRELIPRLPAANLLPDDPALIEKILAVQ